jgi:hypothetical protein
MTRFLLCAPGILAVAIGVAVVASSADASAMFVALVVIVCGVMLFSTGMIVGAVEALRPRAAPVPQQWSQQP